MAYGYMRTDPAQAFRNAVEHYKKLIAVAVEEGFTEDQAIELLKVYGLFRIESSMGNY